MNYIPELAEIRFGFGLSPVLPPPESPAQILAGLSRQDDMTQQFPIPTYTDALPAMQALRKIRQNEGRAASKEEARERFRREKNELQEVELGWVVNTMLRRTWSENAFRERLVQFWADHFTAFGKNQIMRFGTLGYVEEAIRPNVAGKFSDLLVAAVMHPIMLNYLDQNISTGPNSPAAAKARKNAGLNENLAREVLELHTLGVNGPYTQADVRQLAELFTGMVISREGSFAFRARRAEPGAENVLGKRYGGNPARVSAIKNALRDLARHPATARHVAKKLAIHFVADTPPVALVSDLERAFLEHDGDLIKLYGVLLNHPDAWKADRSNFKPPQDFIASTWRALAVRPEHAAKLGRRRIRLFLIQPLVAMGQRFQRPLGPDGWPEEDSAWITPQGISTRLKWAISAPIILRPELPDPRDFVHDALGPFADEHVLFAARAAEQKTDAIGLVLASPPFQRR
ncbi:MAG: DUF1800 family protein [Arenibacterium sp.]